jgi:hypothetical protein
MADNVFFSAVLADEGSMCDVQLRTGVWAEVVNEAIVGGEAPFLEPYTSLAWLLAADVSLSSLDSRTPMARPPVWRDLVSC